MLPLSTADLENIESLVKNLQTLGFKKSSYCKNDSFILDNGVFSQGRDHAVAFQEITHFLFNAYNEEATNYTFKYVWPVTTPQQSIQYFKIARSWLFKFVKANPTYFGDVVINTLSDYRHPKVIKLLLILSKQVIRSWTKKGIQFPPSRAEISEASSSEINRSHKNAAEATKMHKDNMKYDANNVKDRAMRNLSNQAKNEVINKSSANPQWKDAVHSKSLYTSSTTAQSKDTKNESSEKQVADSTVNSLRDNMKINTMSQHDTNSSVRNPLNQVNNEAINNFSVRSQWRDVLDTNLSHSSSIPAQSKSTVAHNYESDDNAASNHEQIQLRSKPAVSDEQSQTKKVVDNDNTVYYDHLETEPIEESQTRKESDDNNTVCYDYLETEPIDNEEDGANTDCPQELYNNTQEFREAIPVGPNPFSDWKNVADDCSSYSYSTTAQNKSAIMHSESDNQAATNHKQISHQSKIAKHNSEGQTRKGADNDDTVYYNYSENESRDGVKDGADTDRSHELYNNTEEFREATPVGRNTAKKTDNYQKSSRNKEIPSGTTVDRHSPIRNVERHQKSPINYETLSKATTAGHSPITKADPLEATAVKYDHIKKMGPNQISPNCKEISSKATTTIGHSPIMEKHLHQPESNSSTNHNTLSDFSKQNEITSKKRKSLERDELDIDQHIKQRQKTSDQNHSPSTQKSTSKDIIPTDNLSSKHDQLNIAHRQIKGKKQKNPAATPSAFNDAVRSILERKITAASKYYTLPSLPKLEVPDLLQQLKQLADDATENLSYEKDKESFKNSKQHTHHKVKSEQDQLSSTYLISLNDTAEKHNTPNNYTNNSQAINHIKNYTSSSSPSGIKRSFDHVDTEDSSEPNRKRYTLSPMRKPEQMCRGIDDDFLEELNYAHVASVNFVDREQPPWNFRSPFRSPFFGIDD